MPPPGGSVAAGQFGVPTSEGGPRIPTWTMLSKAECHHVGETMRIVLTAAA